MESSEAVIQLCEKAGSGTVWFTSRGNSVEKYSCVFIRQKLYKCFDHIKENRGFQQGNVRKSVFIFVQLLLLLFFLHLSLPCVK